MNFTELGVKEEIVRGLSELGITEPTVIQQKSIPHVKEGHDLIGMSNTGSGKTAAFGIPLLEMIIPGKGIQALTVAPTRELAVQIARELKKFSKYLGIHIAVVYGGVGLGLQAEQLTTADVVVGTPGRTLDHLNRRNMDLSAVRCVVLDEADKMAEMGFIDDITKILDCTPEKRQVLLFGATISTEIDTLAHNYMRNPVSVEAERQVRGEFLKQYYYGVQPREKFSFLVHLLKQKDIEMAIVFCSARSTVEMIVRNLRAQQIRAEMIHGKMSQSSRLQIMDSFNRGKFPVLVASAVAARGLHIEGISHIFNYDLSQDPQEYVHRVGRTARAGRSGKAITLLDPRDYDVFRQILDRYPLEVQELSPGQFPRLPFNTGMKKREYPRFSWRTSDRGRSRSAGHYSNPRNRSRDLTRAGSHRVPAWA